MLLYKEKIGVVLSDSGFSRYLTVKDIKDILKNTYIAFDEQLFTKYIEKYQLSADKKLEQFSLGMKAKLKLITAISHKAKLLIIIKLSLFYNGNIQILMNEECVFQLIF